LSEQKKTKKREHCKQKKNLGIVLWFLMSILSLLSVPRRLLASNATAVASSVNRAATASAAATTTTTSEHAMTASVESSSSSSSSTTANATKNLKLIAGKSLIADYIARNDVPAAAQMLGEALTSFKEKEKKKKKKKKGLSLSDQTHNRHFASSRSLSRQRRV
jgi:hypothetical protein